MSGSEPVNTDRVTKGKGDSRDGSGDDPAEEFEDDPDSEAAADAQSTLDSLTADVEEGEPVDVSSTDSFTSANLLDDGVANELADSLGRGDQDAQQIQSLGANNLTPSVDSHINIDAAEELQPFGDTDMVDGGSAEAMWVGRTEDGDQMIITLGNDEAAGDPVEGTASANALRNALPQDAQEQVKFPDMNADTERNAAVLENVGADDSASVSDYIPFDTDAEFSKDQYLSAVGSKLLIGDTDIGGNVVTSSDGNFHPIDFDVAGRDLEAITDMKSDGDATATFSRYERRIDNYTALYDFDVGDGSLQQKTQELANEVDMDKLSENLESNPNVSEHMAETVKSNIRWIRQLEGS